MVKWYQDLARTMEYLRTRSDIDHERIAYFGLSMGAVHGPVMLALEPGFRAAILCHGGLAILQTLPEADSIHFAPRVTLPTLMINGRRDHIFSLEKSQIPLFRALGTPDDQKRHVVHEGGHSIAQHLVVKETLDWLDQHLGPVRRTGTSEPAADPSGR